MSTKSTEPVAPRDERLMLEAILDGDGKSWRAYSSSLPGDLVFQTLAIATSAAVFRKWPEDPSLQEIVDYVKEIEHRYPSELPVARADIEAVIRGSFSESDVLDGTASEQVIVAEVLIIKSIGFDVLDSPSQRDAFFSEVIDAIDGKD